MPESTKDRVRNFVDSCRNQDELSPPVKSPMGCLGRIAGIAMNSANLGSKRKPRLVLGIIAALCIDTLERFGFDDPE